MKAMEMLFVALRGRNCRFCCLGQKPIHHCLPPLQVIVFILGSLSNDDGDRNENGKKTIGLDKQNNNFARASRFFVHFFAVLARLRRENA